MPTTHALECRGLVVTYGTLTAVDRVSFDVGPPAVVGALLIAQLRLARRTPEGDAGLAEHRGGDLVPRGTGR